MEKIIININMDINDNNITISTDSKEIIIKNDTKEINAKEIYDLINYSKGNVYDIHSNIDEINDEHEKEYLNDIVTLFSDIINDINDLDNQESIEEEQDN